jgi:transcriptional regulator with XRE-family HTH domain
MQLVTRVDVARVGHNNDDQVAYENAGRRVAKWRQAHDAKGATRKGHAKAMSQIALAKKARVSVGCLQGLETGARATRDKNLKKIADAIGLTVAELTSDETETSTIIRDPRGYHLSDEDYAIAHLFHDAHTEVRVQVKADLQRHATERESPSRATPTAAAVGDRRSEASGDRHEPDAEAVHLAMLKLRTLPPAVLARLDTLIEIGADDATFRLIERLRQGQRDQPGLSKRQELWERMSRLTSEESLANLLGAIALLEDSERRTTPPAAAPREAVPKTVKHKRR